MQSPRMRGRGIATVVCLLAILLGGCGSSGSQSDQAQISQVVRAYLRAQAHGHGRAACALLAPTGRAELVELVLTAARGVVTRRPTCARAVRLVRGIVGTPTLSSLVNVDIKQIRITGRTADAQILDPEGRFPPQRVGFQKENAGWRIAAVRG